MAEHTRDHFICLHIVSVTAYILQSAACLRQSSSGLSLFVTVATLREESNSTESFFKICCADRKFNSPMVSIDVECLFTGQINKKNLELFRVYKTYLMYLPTLIFSR